MKRGRPTKNRILLAITAFLCGLVPLLRAQQGVVSLHKTLTRPHQLREVIGDLQLAGWFVTLEEAPVLSKADLETRSSPTGLPVIVRRTVPWTIDMPATKLASSDNKSQTNVLREILRSYQTLGNRETYRVVRGGGYLNVVPDQIVDQGGYLRAFEPILDTKISFPEQHFDNLIEVVETVLRMVSQERGVNIVVGGYPNNIFRESSMMEVADNEPARDVLARAFGELNGERYAAHVPPIGLPWTLSYDPTGNQYWFDVTPIPLTPHGSNATQKVSAAPNESSITPHVMKKTGAVK